MIDFEIRFARKSESKRLSELSQEFASEGCCNGIVADTEEFFRGKKVAVAVCQNQLVGYCHGNILKEENKRSYADAGDLFFELEEIFVLKSFRNQKIGRALFEFAVDHAKKMGCKTIRLNAVSKNYKKLLKFYTDILGMDFISAYLIKRIG